jgi:hypothetical protein
MGLFTKKPVLPDYKGMPVEERMKDPAWYDVVSGVPGFSNATLVTNADNGHIMSMGSVTNVDAGILTITPKCVRYAYSGKHEVGHNTQSVERANLRHKNDLFIMMFGNEMNTWMFSSNDHGPFLEGFKRARGYIA